MHQRTQNDYKFKRLGISSRLRGPCGVAGHGRPSSVCASHRPLCRLASRVRSSGGPEGKQVTVTATSVKDPVERAERGDLFQEVKLRVVLEHKWRI